MRPTGIGYYHYCGHLSPRLFHIYTYINMMSLYRTSSISRGEFWINLLNVEYFSISEYQKSNTNEKSDA